MPRHIKQAIITLSFVAPTIAANVALSGPPSILSMFQQKSAAVAEQKFDLQRENGPWMILAMTFSGDDAEAKALALAKELRQSLTRDVYVHHKEFDRTQTLATRYRQREDGVHPLNVKYNRATRERDFAVLVGNYMSSDDPQILEMLQRVRTAYPKTLSDMANATKEDTAKTTDSNWLVGAARVMSWKKSNKAETKKKGPMGFAFVTRNPLLPDEYFQRNGAVDEFVLNLNQEIGEEKIEYPLLKCPGRYTVRVASFQGQSATVVSTGSKMDDKDASDQLDEAAMQAHKLTLALRAKKVEAYEFHDRYGSYVTIGSFDSLGAEGPDGQFAYHQEIINILKTWCGHRVVISRDPVTQREREVASANSLEKIPFDIEGKPISVPRPSTSKLYQGSLLGKQRIQP